MELQIKEFTTPDPIAFNFAEVRDWIAERSKDYASVVYGDEDIKQAKEDRANLNRLKKALNDRRIEIEKEYMKPFLEFKNAIAELIRMIDEPAQLIDARIKEYEERKKDEKKAAIEELFADMEEKPEWLELRQIWNPRWLNATTSMKSIEEEIAGTLLRISQDLQTLGSLQEFGFEAMEEYKRTLDINRAVAEGQRLADIQRRKAEKLEEERRREQEAAQRAVKAEPEPDYSQDEVVYPKMDERAWVTFRAYLTTEDAIALKEFFTKRGVVFEKA